MYARNTALCKSYRILLKRLRQIERDILYSGTPPANGMPHASGTGDPTAAKAERLVRLKADTERKVQAINAAYDLLPDDTARDMIRRNVFDGIPMQNIDTPMSIRTMKRIRSEFVRRVAENMGEA